MKERFGLRWRVGLGVPVGLLYLLLIRPGPFDPEWPHALLLLAALALVPVALELAIRASAGDDLFPDRLLRDARWLQPAAAVLLVVAYGQNQGVGAALATVPWLIFTGTVALAGLLRIRQRGLRALHHDPGKAVMDAGLVFLAVGSHLDRRRPLPPRRDGPGRPLRLPLSPAPGPLARHRLDAGPPRRRQLPRLRGSGARGLVVGERPAG